MLKAAGLTPAEENAYRMLLDATELDLESVARTLQVSLDEAGALLDSLESKGLVACPSDTPASFTAIPPDVSLEPLLRSRQESLEWARAEVARLAETYRANARRRDVIKLVEIITGAPAIRQALRNFQHSTQKESMWFCRAGYVAMPSAENAEEIQMLAEGVEYRVLYERALLEEPGMIDSVADGIRHGEMARAAQSLPVRLAIADRSVALCPLVASGAAPGEPSVALVRGSNLLEALIALFESYWANASPLLLSGPGDDTAVRTPAHEGSGGTISADDRRLLALLVAGVPDKAVAGQLRVSHRTVQRRIRALMDRVNADTRMQLAWQAARRGWV